MMSAIPHKRRCRTLRQETPGTRKGRVRQEPFKAALVMIVPRVRDVGGTGRRPGHSRFARTRPGSLESLGSRALRRGYDFDGFGIRPALVGGAGHGRVVFDPVLWELV